MVKNPVLFMTFARPEYAKQSWEAIKKAQPRVLYFYSNKGRTEKDGEIERNDEIRGYVNEIDWECDLHTWFRDEYVDVYSSLLGAKMWAFKDEETLIMLEEDCMAGQAFFQFCDRFLDIYKEDKRINFITGDNYATDYSNENRDHYITRSLHHHGWATWKDRWLSINWKMMPEDIIKDGSLKQYFSDDLPQYYFWERVFSGMTKFIEETHCWDYVKVFNQISSHTYAVTPVCNLVQNIGTKGVHETGESSLQLGTLALEEDYPFLAGVKLSCDDVDTKYDICESKAECHRTSFVRFVASKIKHDWLRL